MWSCCSCAATPDSWRVPYTGDRALLARHMHGMDNFDEKFFESIPVIRLAEEPCCSPAVELCISAMLGGEELGVRVKAGHCITTDAVICCIYGELYISVRSVG